MLFVRPGRLADLDALEQMARTAQPVLHSLPHDRRALEARIALSEDSFRAEVDFPGEEFYLFVLEDCAERQADGHGEHRRRGGLFGPVLRVSQRRADSCVARIAGEPQDSRADHVA